MSDEESFLLTCTAEPANDFIRLVYADWLEERGDVRARYLRLEFEIRGRYERREEAADLETELASLCDVIDPDWREAAGPKCDLTLHSFVRERKIEVVIWVREFTGLKLAETVEMVETVPRVILRNVSIVCALQAKTCIEGHEWMWLKRLPGPPRRTWEVRRREGSDYAVLTISRPNNGGGS